MKNNDHPGEISRRVSVLEFFLTLTITAFLTFAYGITQIFKIEWYPRPIALQAVKFFIVSFFALNFILFLINAIEKAGPTFRSLLDQWKKQGSLNKIITLFGIPSSILGIIDVIQWIISFLR